MSAGIPVTDADHTMRLGDGRRFAWREYGMALGRPVLALHGTPGSRFMYAMAHDAAMRAGLRLIAPDRWAYGLTDPHPQPSLSAWAEDAAAFADALELERFSVLGLSGGGPYATATAAVLGDRVEALALVVPVGPIVGPLAGPDTLKNIGPKHRFSFTIAGPRPWLIRSAFATFAAMLRVAPGPTVRSLGLGTCEADRELLASPALQDHLARTFGAGLAPGALGSVIDLRMYSSPWDITPESITARTRIWIGDRDGIVPNAAITQLAHLIPGAVTLHLKNQGHFWIAPAHTPVLDWLANGNAETTPATSLSDGSGRSLTGK